MDYNYAEHYDCLLTRKCSCGGTAEMLVDFVADFVVRCSSCHQSTHAYIKPEDAAAHWNSGDDVMQDPLHIFWDDPEGNMQGEIVAIHISDDEFVGISPQSCDFNEAIIEYRDKMYSVEHERFGEGGLLNIGHISSFNPEIYRHTVRPMKGEQIQFVKILYTADGNVEGLAFRWADSYLFVFADEYNLVLTRSSVDLSDEHARVPTMLEEPKLHIEITV